MAKRAVKRGITDLAYQLERVLGRLDYLERRVTQLEEDRQARTDFPYTIDDASLTEDQLLAFRELQQVEGRDVNAMRRAEQIFNDRLVDTPATETAVKFLAHFLRHKCWCIDFEGMAAKPTWQRDQRARFHGGYLVYGYRKKDGQHTKSCHRNQFEPVTFIHEPTRRRRS